jgi:hypothetical protein
MGSLSNHSWSARNRPDPWTWYAPSVEYPSMIGGLFGLLVFAVLAVAGLFSLWLYPHLPEHYRSAETTSNVRLGMGVIATITAVVLGLLISSVKGSFDLASRDVQALAADLIVADRTLRFYGPDAAHARDLLARYTERVLEGTWPSGGQAPIVDDQVAEHLLDQTEHAILSLQPAPQEPDFKEQALSQVRSIVRRRQMLIEESGSAVSPPIVVALTLWLALIFASFGYNAPRNGMTVIVLLVCAASVAGAIFLILAIDGAVQGLIVVSSEPIQRALSIMRR